MDDFPLPHSSGDSEFFFEPGTGKGKGHLRRWPLQEPIVMEEGLQCGLERGNGSGCTAKSGCATFWFRNSREDSPFETTTAFLLFSDVFVDVRLRRDLCGAKCAGARAGGCAEVFGGCEGVDDTGDGRARGWDARVDPSGEIDC